MPIGPSGRPPEPLYVIPTAIALVLAAFAGGALGLIWNASGLGQDGAPSTDQAQES